MTHPNDEQPLDGALREAFGKDSLPGDAQRSVMARLKRTAGVSSRVLLHEDPNEITPILRVRPGAKNAIFAPDERYRVVGEIATGGVGVVYKARDEDLGRDVALKVLREDRQDNEEIFARFFEEAQIGAQLQHPGIVPVYGLGLQQDGLPFFAMKLVKGRTLGALLKERKGPDMDRRALLSVFEQACQTVAYAHAHGVIHRDLKPANIMVGAFGEVLVVDWGFGKVLGHTDRAAGRVRDKHEQTMIATVRSEAAGSQSIVGSVMGTPAYMPPEQAMGQVADLDQRSDVFGLGAILCQLLTGKPPYVGTPRELLQMALQARLDDAHARLDACGAAPELVALCKRCLAPLASERPENASVVAQEIVAFLAAAEERAQGAELDAITQRAQREREEADAAWARRARAKTRTLVAAVVTALVVGVGLWWWQDAESQARADAARPDVEAAMADAVRLAGEERHAEAFTQAEKARDLAETRDVDDALHARTEELFIRLGAAHEDALAQAARLEANASFLAELHEIREQRGDQWDAAQTDANYRAAFVARGVDVDSLDPTQAAERLQAAHGLIALELASVLNEWALQRRTKPVLSEKDATRPLALANLLDPDPQRTRLRQACASGEREALEAFATPQAQQGMSPTTLDVLAVSLFNAGARKQAIALLRRMCLDYPDDFWACLHAGLFLSLTERDDEAAPYLWTATALLPRGVWTRFYLARNLALRGRGQEALTHYKQALALAPENRTLQLRIAVELCGKLGAFAMASRQFVDFAEAERLARSVLRWTEGGSEHSGVYREWAARVLATALTLQGRNEDALLVLEQAWESEASKALLLHLRGSVYHNMGRVEEAISDYRTSIRRLPGRPDLREHLARALVAKGEAEGDKAAREEALALFQEVLALDGSRLDVRDVIGGLLNDLERSDEALPILREGLRIDPSHVSLRQTLGASLQRLGDTEGTREAYEMVIAADPTYWKAWHGRATVLQTQEAWQAALDAIEAATEKTPRRGQVRLLGTRITCLRKLGRKAEIAPLARRILALNPKHLAGGIELCSALINEGPAGRAEAARLIEALLEQAPKDPRVHVLHGNLLSSQGRREDAVTAYDRALRLDASNAIAHDNRGMVLQQLGRLDEAIEAHRKAIKLFEGQPGLPIAHGNLARALRTQGRHAEALPHAREAARLAPESWANHSNLAWTLSDLGEDQEAVLVAREAVRLGNGESDAWSTLARALAAAGEVERVEEVEEAIDAYIQALRLNPASVLVLNGLPQLLIKHGRLDEFVPRVRAVFGEDAPYPLIRLSFAVVSSWQGHYAEALAEARAVERLLPRAPPALLEMARGDLKRALPGIAARARATAATGEAAIAAWQEAIRLEPRYALAYDALLKTLSDLDRADEFATRVREVVGADSSIPFLRWKLARALANQEPPAAAEALKEARALQRLLPVADPRPRPYMEAYLQTYLPQFEAAARVEGKYAALLDGSQKPADPREGLAFAGRLSFDKERLGASARLYRDLLSEGSEARKLTLLNDWYAAAGVAARVAAGRATDAKLVSTAARATWRKQAFAWLTEARRVGLEGTANGELGARDERVDWAGWLKEENFASVRDEEALAKLPEQEAEAWRTFWAAVRADAPEAEGDK